MNKNPYLLFPQRPDATEIRDQGENLVEIPTAVGSKNRRKTVR